MRHSTPTLDSTPARALLAGLALLAPMFLPPGAHPGSGLTAPADQLVNNSPAITATIELDSARTYVLENLGPAINGPTQEFSPSASPDGLSLFFVSDRPASLEKMNIWMARKGSDGVFAMPEMLGGEANSDKNEGSLSVAGDGRRVVFTGCEWSGGIGSCDLYEGELQGAEVRNIRNLEEINSSEWDVQPFISSDGATLLFVSDRNGGGLVNADIYISTRRPDGLWGKPERLGPGVNSDLQEDSPCLTLDGRALLFASRGHDSRGGYDIFIAMRNADGTWGEARNLGSPISTGADDRFISATADASTLYFASKRADLDGFGGLDLYVARQVAPR